MNTEQKILSDEELTDLLNPDVQGSDWRWCADYDRYGGAFIYSGPGEAKPILRESKDVLSFLRKESLAKLGEHYRALAAERDRLAEALRDLLWPRVPSADDLALLIRMTGNTETQNNAMLVVDDLRGAQTKAEQLLASLSTTNTTTNTDAQASTD